jgi:hypothetical protein
MKQKIQISHLVTNGCSFTYCQGLENPREQGWPALIAKKLGVPVVNLASKGSGNDAIFRRTYEYFYLNKHLNNKPFYITAWSFCVRREEFFATYRGLPLEDFQTIDLSSGGTMEKEIVFNAMTDKGMVACERKKMLYWAACLELFKSNNIPYLTTDYMPNSDESIYKILQQKFPTQFESVYNDSNKIANFVNLAKPFADDRLPCGHDGPKAMAVLADYAYEQIMARYDVEVVPATNGFIDLDTYYTDTELMHKANEWLIK